MTELAHVEVHCSVFPEVVKRDLLQGLLTRRIDPKFHYTSYRQAQKWLALHEAYAPSRIDGDCALVFDEAYSETARSLKGKQIHLVGLGSGGGQKEARLIHFLKGQGSDPVFTPCEISLPLALTSRRAAMETACRPLVVDLEHAADLPEVLGNRDNGRSRLLTFFGLIPNFEPEIIMPRLASLVRGGDLLLFSANLAPGPDYGAGVNHVLPGYDNSLTRDWLETFLYDLGVERGDGATEFSIEDSAAAYKRVVANYKFSRSRALTLYGEKFKFVPEDTIRLFFSYRYTPPLIAELLEQYGLKIRKQWRAASDEEGVFLCERAGG